jgi:hypothetical protein
MTQNGQKLSENRENFVKNSFYFRENGQIRKT